MSNIVKGSGVLYTSGKPNTIPQINFDSEFAIDTTGLQYMWNRTTSAWDNLGYGIEVGTSSIAPTHVPSNFRPKFYITNNNKLYHYSGSWNHINVTGSLPNGLISSSAQIGPTGIYSGSGEVNNGTEVRLSNKNNLFFGKEATNFKTSDIDNTIGFGNNDSGSNYVLSGLRNSTDAYTFEGQTTKDNITSSFVLNPDSFKIERYDNDGYRYNLIESGREIVIKAENTYNGENCYIQVQRDLIKIVDNASLHHGIQYDNEYSDILSNDRSIPDVGLVRNLIQTTLPTYHKITAATGSKGSFSLMAPFDINKRHIIVDTGLSLTTLYVRINSTGFNEYDEISLFCNPSVGTIDWTNVSPTFQTGLPTSSTYGFAAKFKYFATGSIWKCTSLCNL